MLKLEERDVNWFVLTTDYNAIGLDYKGLVEVNRLTREKITQLENRRY